MITSEDILWLKKNYPVLVATQNGLTGTIEFTATYKKDGNLFLVIKNGGLNTLGGIELSGIFNIRLEERTDRTFSNLPALFIEEIKTDLDRHISRRDNTACLCSPLEEAEFLTPVFQFQHFFEHLVIPFLYGQLYFEKEGEWPWSDLSHGEIGILESYYRIKDSSKINECIEKLRSCGGWKTGIKTALLQKSDIKGHTACFCPKRDHIRRCHPEAWKGLVMLKNDIKMQGIVL